MVVLYNKRMIDFAVSDPTLKPREEREAEPSVAEILLHYGRIKRTMHGM